MGGVGIALHGCTSMDSLSSDSVKNFTSPQELIAQKNINHANGQAKEYVYDWGAKQSNNEAQSLYPRKYLTHYCSAKGGKFALLYKSSMSLVKDASAKKRLSGNSHVKQGIGAYKCVQNNGQSWIVSIEPTAERKFTDGSETRVVSLQSKVMTVQESQKFYKNISTDTVVKKSAVNNQTVKTTTSKAAITKESEIKKEEKPVVESPVKPVEKALDTPQQQQLKSFVTARRDLNKGQNQLNACNNAQRAYNFGKLPNAGGTNVYAESGMLVARCLTSVPSYSSRFSNSKAQAKNILQNLANNHNHAGAKHMLKQLK